jgi:hypothetical protein
MSTQRLFNISTISDDLTREEAITQIAFTLDYLAQASAEVFGRVDTSIQSARDKLHGYDARIGLVNRKVDAIKGYANKATKVFSSAKYPVPDQAASQADVVDAITLKKWSQLYVSGEVVNMRHKLHKYTTPYAPFDELAFKDKFLEFAPPPGLLDANKNSHMGREGEEVNASMGSVLADSIESVTSLLLFNTAQHPYKQTLVKDPLGDLDNMKRKLDMGAAGESTDIYEAPQSILKGKYFYLFM